VPCVLPDVVAVQISTSFEANLHYSHDGNRALLKTFWPEGAVDSSDIGNDIYVQTSAAIQRELVVVANIATLPRILNRYSLSNRLWIRRADER